MPFSERYPNALTKNFLARPSI